MQRLNKNDKTLYYILTEKNIKHTYFKPQNGYLHIVKAKSMAKDKVFNHLNNHFDRYVELTKKVKENKLNLWGKTYELETINDTVFSYKILDDKIVIHSKTDDIKKDKVLILTQELKSYINTIKDDYLNVLKRYNITEVPFKYKFLMSKFGSYHYKTNQIVLNVFLATLPNVFTDYVIYHEYAHQKEKNHQKGFYQLLSQLYPNYLRIDKALKKVVIKI